MKLAFFPKVVAMAALVAMTAGPLRGDDDETPLGEQMDGISSALKGLRRAEGWDAKVDLAREAQEACLASLKYLPKTFTDIADAKEKAKATADYKRLIGEAYSALCMLESAFLEEDEEAVDVAMDMIKGLKKEGHEKYEDD